MLKIPDCRIVSLLLAGVFALLLATAAQAATVRLSDLPFAPESSKDSPVLYLPNLSVSADGHAVVVAAVAAGSDHTCALTDAGSVMCWGRNESGQLGDGTTAISGTPVAVEGLSSGVAAVAAGADFTCALTSAGGVLCWGGNEYGQLGDGTMSNRSTPVAETGLDSGVVAIAANDHNCAVTVSGGVLCWGSNEYGQLGDGTITNRDAPVSVIGLSSGVAAVAAGGIHTCALTTAGGVLCWGDNRHGQLGDGTTNDHSTPVAMTGLSSGVAAIAAGGSHTCALTAAGGVLCWGSNSAGQLGDGNEETVSSVPVAVIGLSNGVAAVTAGDRYTCALTDAGGVLCWGYNDEGQLGDGTDGPKSTPTPVTGLSSGVFAIAADGGHTCALTNAGGVLCWGSNGAGALGDGTTTDHLTPVAVTGLSSGMAAIAAGSSHTCALTDAGGVLCWGYNGYGRLGDGTTTSRNTPVAVVGLSSGVSAVTAGRQHTCALTTAGGVLCWGANSAGQLGIDPGWTPVAVVWP